MSDFFFKAKNKQTGEVIDVAAMDDHYGSHQYGYKVGNRILPEYEFEREYEEVTTPMGTCCGRCEKGESGYYNHCLKPSCECHTTTQPTVRMSEQKSLHSTEEAQATTSTIITYTPVSNYERVSHTHCWDNQPSPCGIPLEKHTQCCLCDLKVPVSEPQVGFLRQYLNESPDWKGKKFTDEDLLRFLRIPDTTTPTPPDTRPAYLWDKEAKDVARTVGNMIRENEGTTPTPPPTGNYFQYRADPSEKKLEFDAPPTDGWEERFQEVVKKLNLREETVSGVDEYSMVRNLITQALAEQKTRMVEEVRGMKVRKPICDCKTHPEHNCGITSNETCDDIIKALSK